MVQQFKSSNEIFEAAAALFVQCAKKAIADKGQLSVALTGGSSPIGLHHLLASDEYRHEIDWSKVLIFWGDERWVPLDDDLSNAKMAYETLLDNVPVTQAHIFPMFQEGTEPEAYAAKYEAILKEKLGDGGALDFIFLGMGDDGHTASLFPHTAVLHEQEKWVDAYYLEPQKMYRITLTAPFINRAENIVVISFGEKKANALQEVVQGAYHPAQYPSQLLKPSTGKLIFMVDEAAAKNLTQ